MAKQAVLLLAHGTPETVEQIPEYLRNVVSGRTMPPHLVDEIQRRYELIGHSPLTEITLEQARLVEAEFDADARSAPAVPPPSERMPPIAPRRAAAEASFPEQCTDHGRGKFFGSGVKMR